MPKAQVFDATTNPTGTRCDLADANVNILGTDPATGFARRPLDNVGVAYGLKALTNGTITVDQFLDLNAAVGGYDINGQIQPTRTVGDTHGVRDGVRQGPGQRGRGPVEGAHHPDQPLHRPLRRHPRPHPGLQHP